MIYNIVLVSGIQQSDSVIHICVCVCVCVYVYIYIYIYIYIFRFSFHIGHHRIFFNLLLIGGYCVTMLCCFLLYHNVNQP